MADPSPDVEEGTRPDAAVCGGSAIRAGRFHRSLRPGAGLLTRVWGEKSEGDLRPMRTMMGKLRRKLGEDVEQPRYIFTEPRVGYRMAKGEEPANVESVAPPSEG